MYVAHPSGEVPDPPYVAPAVDELGTIMGRYSQRLNQILWRSPYTPAQLTEALAHIRATHGEIARYEDQLAQRVPESIRQPKVAAWFGYHRQTLEQACNIYQGIARSLSLPSGAAPTGPIASDIDPSERIRRLLAGCCIHCEEHLGAALYTVTVCPRCGRYTTR